MPAKRRKIGYSGQKQLESAYYTRKRIERNSIFSQAIKKKPGTVVQRILRLPQQARKTQSLRLRQINNLLMNPGGINATRVWVPPVGEEEYQG